MTPHPLSTLSGEVRPGLEATLRVGNRLVDERLYEWTQSPIPFLQEGSHRLLRAGGKRFRPTLTLLSYLAHGARPFSPDVLDAAAMVELLHTATLVHDDIIDDADTRRGLPSANRLYGESRAILVGDHLFAAASSCIPRLPAATQRIMVHAARLLAEGEASELELTRAGAATLEDYFVVIAKKTASLFEASCAAGALGAGAPPGVVETLGEFGFHAGIAFQLVDDLLDVEGVTEIMGKPARWDLSRGVPNAAVLATLEAESRGRPALLQLPSGVQTEMEDLLARIGKMGGDERVRRLARMYATRALEGLGRVPESEARRWLQDQVQESVTRLH